MTEENDDSYEFDGPLSDEEALPEKPRAHGVRFGEGQPINLRGRPKGSLNRSTIIKRVAAKRHKVRLEGRTRQIDTLRLVLMTVRTRAGRGEIAAFDLQEQLRSSYPGLSANQPRAILFLPGKLTREEWSAVYHPEGEMNDAVARFPHLRHVCADQQEYRDRRRIEGC